MSLSSTPIINKRKIIGAINIASKRKHKFSDEEKDLLESIGRETGTIITKMVIEEKLKMSESKLRLLNKELKKKVEKKIRELMESEIKFRKLNKELEYILDTVPALIFYKDTENRFIRVNKLIADAHGVGKQELKGKNLFELYNREVAQAYWDDDLAVIKSGVPKVDIEEPWETEKGIKWVNTNKLPFINEDGNVIGIIGFSTDITDRKIAELNLKESEARFRSTFEQAGVGIAHCEIDGSFIQINQRFCDILKYSKDELLCHKFQDITHPDDLEEDLSNANQLLRSEIEKFSMEKRYICKDGSIVWVNLTVSLLYKTSVEQNYFLAVINDITKKKEAEKLIIEENKKLAELNLIKKNLITRISHELKTPLSSIHGASHILLSFHKDAMNTDILKLSEIIFKGSQRLKRLVEDLLDISMLDHDVVYLDKKNTDLLELLHNCVVETGYLIKERDHILRLETPDHCYFKVDELRLVQVIINLLTNAIKNTPPNGNIVLGLEENSAFLDFFVEDNGVGLTTEEKQRLFMKFGKIERFGQNMDVNIEGSGLGLYISKEIVELHGGEILVESEGRNKGAKFTIRLLKEHK